MSSVQAERCDIDEGRQPASRPVVDQSTALPRTRILPVILAGGSGTRLWPISREHYPKQLIDVVGSDSLLQAT
ncbi:sugar phosphate nucleotidyltransferase, partial [Cobetia sp. SIMBA_158]